MVDNSSKCGVVVKGKGSLVGHSFNSDLVTY